MKLYYISPRDMRKNRADPVHIMKSCDTFSQLGLSVVVVTPRFYRKEYYVRKKDLWGLYSLTPRFRILELPTVLTDQSSPINMSIQKFLVFSLFYLWLAIKTIFERDKIVLYSKCYVSIIPAIFIKKIFNVGWHIFFEKPEFLLSDTTHSFVCSHMDGIVAINKYIAHNVARGYHVSREKVHTLKFYSDIHEFSKHRVTTSEARRLVGLPEDDYLVIYAGKVYQHQREAEYIIEAAKHNREKTFVLVGARDAGLKFYEQYLKNINVKNVVVRGFQKLKDMYYYIQAADILVSYYENDYFHSYCSVPAKLALYVCAHKPVILADLPALRSIFDRSMIFYVKPDLPLLLADMIKHIEKEKEEVSQKSSLLHTFALQNDIMNFGKDIVRFIESRCNTGSVA